MPYLEAEIDGSHGVVDGTSGSATLQTLPERQDHNLVLTVSYVPYLEAGIDGGHGVVDDHAMTTIDLECKTSLVCI